LVTETSRKIVWSPGKVLDFEGLTLLRVGPIVRMWTNDPEVTGSFPGFSRRWSFIGKSFTYRHASLHQAAEIAAGQKAVTA